MAQPEPTSKRWLRSVTSAVEEPPDRGRATGRARSFNQNADIQPRDTDIDTGLDPDTATAALRRAGRGNEAAFAEFYDELGSLVYGIVLRVVRDPAIAQEVSQDVFLEVWSTAPRFAPTKGSARSWTATIAHRRAVDRVRSVQASRRREANDLADRVSLEDSQIDTVAELVGDRFERNRVAAALDHLSEPQREAITLAYYGGHTYREVALLLDVAEGTIKTRIRDGLIRLRDHLEVTA